MNILYISSYCDSDVFEKFGGIKSSNHAIQKYHRLLIEGLAAQDNVIIDAYTGIQDNSHEMRLLQIVRPWNHKNITVHYAPVIKIKGVRNVIIALSTFFYTLKAPNGTVVLCDILRVSAAIGAICASKLRRFKQVAIVTDLPEFQAIAKRIIGLKINNYLVAMQDKFVFLTAAMNHRINKKMKPYIVLEGHVDKSMADYRHRDVSKDDLKIIIYAGGLDKKYGIKMLTEAFCRVCYDNEILQIYGSGDYVEELMQLNNKNIRYMGNVANEEVVYAELGAVLLVNPRPSHEEYTKYSFPSKTLEYMASSTPVLMCRLPGIPIEYNDYVYYFDKEDAQGMAATLRTILDKPIAELLEKGESAKKFVLREKNNIIQAKKIIDFISNEEIK